MTTTDTSIKKPAGLDFNQWVEYTLNSSDEAERLIALEELSYSGILPKLKARLRELAGRDRSYQCRQQSAWLLSLDNARTELRPKMKGLEITPDTVSALIGVNDSARSLAVTQLLRKAPSEAVLELWRGVLNNPGDPGLVEIALTLLGKFGNQADARLAIPFIARPEADIACAALTLLQLRDVDLFKTNLRAVLSSKNFKLQMHAVSLLRQVDLNEAVKYIQFFLLNKSTIIRQKALRELMLIDFKKVENLFLQYLGKETNPLLLVKAGYVAAFNPSHDFPLKLYDILLLSHGDKKDILQQILKQSIESIQAAGLLSMPLDTYMAQLKQRITQRRSEILVRMAVRDLFAPDADARLAAVQTLTPYSRYESIQKALQKQAKIELDPEIKAALTVLLINVPAEAADTAAETSSVSTPKQNDVPQPILPDLSQLEGTVSEAPKQAPASSSEHKEQTVADTSDFPTLGKFAGMSLVEQRMALSVIKSPEAYSVVRQTLQGILKLKCPKSVLIETLRLIETYGSAADGNALGHLTEVGEPSVRAGAVKAMGKLNIDALLPSLNRLLADEDPRIKTAALEVYLVADKDGAVQYITSILKSGNHTTRALGLSLLPKLDYASAEPILLALLKREPNQDLLMKTAYMIAANPTQDGLIKLFAFCHDKQGVLTAGYEDLWGLAMISAESVFERPAAELENSCWDAYKAELDEMTPERLSYSYKAVLGDQDAGLPPPPPKEDTFFEKMLLFIYEWKITLTFILVMLLPISYYVFLRPSGGSSSGSGSKFSDTPVSMFGQSGDTDSSASTQVGSDGWKGHIKTNAKKILGGKSYAALMQRAADEVKEVREEFKKAEADYYARKANDFRESEEAREMSAAMAHPTFSRAMTAMKTKNYQDAVSFFEQCADDTSLNQTGRLLAMRHLSEMAKERGDNALQQKWLSRLLKELHKTPAYSDVKGFDDMDKIFSSLMNVGQYLAGGGSSSDIISGLKKRGSTDEEARKGVEALKRMNKSFEKDGIK